MGPLETEIRRMLAAKRARTQAELERSLAGVETIELGADSALMYALDMVAELEQTVIRLARALDERSE